MFTEVPRGRWLQGKKITETGPKVCSIFYSREVCEEPGSSGKRTMCIYQRPKKAPLTQQRTPFEIIRTLSTTVLANLLCRVAREEGINEDISPVPFLEQTDAVATEVLLSCR